MIKLWRRHRISRSLTCAMVIPGVLKKTCTSEGHQCSAPGLCRVELVGRDDVMRERLLISMKMTCSRIAKTRWWSVAVRSKVNLTTIKHSNTNMIHSESESCSVMFDSLQPHGLYSPWNSPGQNTGVGSLSFSRGSSQPREQIQVSSIAG